MKRTALPDKLKRNPSETPMNNILRALSASPGGVAIKSKGTQDPFTMWELNMSHAAPLIVNEAVILTVRYYAHANGKDAETHALDMQTLDFIAKFYISYHKMAMDDRKEAMAGFGDLYKYLDNERSREVYAYFTASFIQSMYCYIYTSASMGAGLERGMTGYAAELTDTYTIMSQLSEETRRIVYKELDEQGAFPGTSNIALLKKRTPAFKDIIVGEQELQLQKMKGRQAAKDKADKDAAKKKVDRKRKTEARKRKDKK